MNRKWAFIIVVLVAASVLFWLRFRIPTVEDNAASLSDAPQTVQFDSDHHDVDKTSPIVPDSGGGREVTPNAEFLENTIRENVREFKQSLVRPIAFYGKTVDEENHPISNVRISFQWNNPSTSTEENHLVAETDSQGLFSIQGISGINLTIALEKAGYYISKQSAFNYVFASELDPNFHQPDSNNPVIFRLWRKGPGTVLITSQYGVSQHLSVKLPRDGTPIRVDLFERKVDSRGQIEISQNKPEYEQWKEADEWRIRIAIPDGGLLEHHDEFPFMALEEGYKPGIEFLFRKGEADWVTDFRKQYYITFGNPRRYGRLIVETSIEMAGIRLDYAINPQGSRYLEPRQHEQ